VRYGYIFTSGVLPAAHDICATGSHLRCAAGKLFSSSEGARAGYIFTSGVLPAAHDICATGSHIRCAAGKLFSSSDGARAASPTSTRKRFTAALGPL
jgi:hypothetical protein